MKTGNMIVSHKYYYFRLIFSSVNTFVLVFPSMWNWHVHLFLYFLLCGTGMFHRSSMGRALFVFWVGYHRSVSIR